MRTLTSLLDEVKPPEIDFLKVDVEGAERDVLEGLDLSRYRPRVLVIEATRPMRADLAHHGWEPLVLGAGYLFAYFDGLNRYYVDRSSSELLKCFEAPPNILDDYHIHEVLQLRERTVILGDQISGLQLKIASLESQLGQVSSDLAMARVSLNKASYRLVDRIQQKVERSKALAGVFRWLVRVFAR